MMRKDIKVKMEYQTSVVYVWLSFLPVSIFQAKYKNQTHFLKRDFRVLKMKMYNGFKWASKMAKHHKKWSKWTRFLWQWHFTCSENQSFSSPFFFSSQSLFSFSCRWLTYTLFYWFILCHMQTSTRTTSHTCIESVQTCNSGKLCRTISVQKLYKMHNVSIISQ